jgi:hypothetical protein
MNGPDNEHTDEERTQEPLELTASQRKAFETLPRERIPSAALEDRVVGALGNRGLLGPRRPRVIELTGWRIAAVAAAALALLTGGFALGQWAGARQVQGEHFIVSQAGDISAAATLQQAGSAYVTALQRFAALPDSVDGDQAVQGREVALTTLYTAAGEVTRLVPRNELAWQLLAAIDTDAAMRSAGSSGRTADGVSRIIEF